MSNRHHDNVLSLWVLAVVGALLIVVVLLSSGCRMLPPAPQKGSAYTAKLQHMALVPTPDAPQLVPVGEVPQLEFTQGENQDTPSTQVYERTVEAAGSSVTETLTTSMGTSQHDKARDEWGSIAKFEAKLKSYGSIKLFGFMLIVAALGMFWPAVRAFTGTTVQLVTGGTGLAMVFGAQLMAGNEWFILVAIGGVAALYVLRRSWKREGEIDANKNGIPDAIEATIAKLKGK